MTYSTECKKWLRENAHHYFFPRDVKKIRTAKGTKAPKGILHPDEAGNQLLWPPLLNLSECYVDFSLVMRGIKTEPSYPGDVNFAQCGADYLKEISAWLRRILLNPKFTVSRLVVCMDEMGRTPACKAALTYSERQKDLEDVSQKWPQHNPFADDKPIPADINAIWYYFPARVNLVQYVTNYLVHHFTDIPEGRTLVIEGGRLPDTDEFHSGCLCPLQIRSVEVPELTAAGIVTVDRIISHSSRHTQQPAFGTGFPPAEGELKMFNQMYCRPSTTMSEAKRVVVMKSVDGDTITIALLQHLRWCSEVKLYILGKRSLGQEKHPDHVYQALLQKFDACDKSKKSRKPSPTKTVYGSEYLYMNGLCKFIQAQFGSKLDFCLLTALRGNDYVKALPGVGFTFILKAYSDHRDKLQGIVDVISEADATAPEKLSVYSIDVAKLFWLCYYAYTDKCSSSSYKVDEEMDLDLDSRARELARQKGCRCRLGQEQEDCICSTDLVQAEAVYSLMYERIESDIKQKHSNGDRKTLSGIPATPDSIWNRAYNLRWLFHYFSNGACPLYHQLTGMEHCKEKGVSLFGYEYKDPNGEKTAANVGLSENVDKSVPHICTYIGPQASVPFESCTHCTNIRPLVCDKETTVTRLFYSVSSKKTVQQALELSLTQQYPVSL